MFNEQLIYKVVIWAFSGISLQTEKVALTLTEYLINLVQVNYTPSVGSVRDNQYKLFHAKLFCRTRPHHFHIFLIMSW